MSPIDTAPLPPRYEMLGELGRGGMGIVYKARDGETGEILALKILKPEIAANTQVLERFKNELLLAHKITHRNIARLYEFHRYGDSVYLSMEFVEGESLRGLLDREGKLTPARGLEFARQLAAGLAEAHRQSIVHRDLKPENIMLTPGGELKVMDFGISRSYAEDVTSTGGILGTPAYMAPEQAEGKPVDHRTDIYALGLILYEMFTGEAAFSGDTAVTLALKQIRERPKPLRSVDPTVPRHLETAILKCLEKDPPARFQSVQELLRALEGEPQQTILQPRKAAPRRWLAVLLIAGAVTFAAAAAVLWLTRHTDSVRFALDSFTLGNGLHVVLSVDHSSPTFSLAVAYRGGYRAEKPGQSGLAHLLEHAMYQGSPNVARSEYSQLIAGAGGLMNSGTTADLSFFYMTLPANQLELALFLESDRMRSLEITPEGVNAARATLMEERTLSVSNPYNRAKFRLSALSFDAAVNQRSSFGTAEDIQRATPEDVSRFYQTYFTTANAAVVLVGDFDPAKAKERIRHYFESIPSRPAPARVDSREPGRTAEKRESTTDPKIQTPSVLMSWRVPPATDPDWFAVKRLAEILGANDASRLQTSLIRGAGVAGATLVNLEDSAGPNLLIAMLILPPGKDPAQAESMAQQEIERIAREGVSEEELRRFETDALRRRAFQLVTTTVRSSLFAQYDLAYGQLASVNEWEKAERAVSSKDVQRMAAKYFAPSNRTVFLVMPAGAPASQGGRP